jgi:hypothetical protein
LQFAGKDAVQAHPQSLLVERQHAIVEALRFANLRILRERMSTKLSGRASRSAAIIFCIAFESFRRFVISGSSTIPTLSRPS